MARALWSAIIVVDALAVALVVAIIATREGTMKLAGLSMGGGLLLTFFLLTILSGASVIWFSSQLASFAFIVPIIFLFIAIGAFLLLLLHYASSLHEMKPALPVSALGLPEGSIRAFLTIGLLSLVAVFGTFIYFESGKGGYGVLRANVDVSEKDALATLKATVGPGFVVIPVGKDRDGKDRADVIAATPDSSRTDIAKQLLTMIATVLTTVIGFYFGTRATEGSTGKVGIDPEEIKRRSEAILEMTALTQDLEERRKRVDDLLTQAAAEAAALKSSNADPQGDAETKVGGHRTKLGDAWAALSRAKEVAAASPEDTKAVLEARDAATGAQAVVADAETKLKAFVDSKQPSAL